MGLLKDIIKAVPDPIKHPKFLQQRRSQSRPSTLSDFCRPVQTPAEHSLFMQCHMLHTNPKSKRTDWLGLTREFNLAVTTKSWKPTYELADLFLKHESHPKQYEKQLVMQASPGRGGSNIFCNSWLASKTWQVDRGDELPFGESLDPQGSKLT